MDRHFDIMEENDHTESTKQHLDVLLVHLPFFDYYHYPTPHLGLLYLASSLKTAGFNVGVLDRAETGADEFIEYVIKFKPRLIGFHVNTDSLARVRRAAGLLKKGSFDYQPLVIFGGPHVSVEDGTLLQDGSGQIVVRGEGEAAVCEIAEWWINGKGKLRDIHGISFLDDKATIIRTPDREFISDLDNIPMPDYNLLLEKPKFNTYQLISGRGCPFHCTFCAEGLSGIKYRFRSPESVLEEIKKCVGNSPKAYLGILDDSFLVDRNRVETIAKMLIKEFGSYGRLVWFCEGRVDFINDNRDLLPLLREAGLVRIQIGVESGNQQMLQMYNKKITVAEIETAVMILKDAEVTSIFGNFIIGGPGETKDTVSESIELAKRLIAAAPGRMECAASMLGLYPGTPISKSPAGFGLKVIDPEMLGCLSLQHPVAVTTSMGVRDILSAYDLFSQEVLDAYHQAIPNIPYALIRDQLKLVSYGLTTRWGGILMRYNTIRSYHESLRLKGFCSIIMPVRQVLELVAHRTARVLDVEAGHLAVKSHPRQVIFNDMAERIYELCSGKLNIAQIISIIKKEADIVPDEPYFTKQVLDILKQLDEKLLVVFSDL